MKIQFLESCFGDPLLQMATTYVVNGRLAVDAGCLGMAKINENDPINNTSFFIFQNHIIIEFQIKMRYI